MRREMRERRKRRQRRQRQSPLPPAAVSAVRTPLILTTQFMRIIYTILQYKEVVGLHILIFYSADENHIYTLDFICLKSPKGVLKCG
jgi:hypothetical protein